MAAKARRDPFRREDRAAGRQAGAGRRRVPFGRAPLRPDERPDVGRPAPGLEGRAGHRGQSAASRSSRFALLDLAGGTGDVAFRVVGSRRRRHARHRLRHQCRHARRRPRARRRSAGIDRRGDLRAGQCRGTALSRPQLRLRHHRLRHPQRAAHRARARARPIACSSIGGRFLCLEFSSRRRAGLDALYELYSFNVIPRIGQAVTGDREAYQYLVESIRKFPKPKAFAEMIEAAGFRRVSFTQHDRRRGGAAFGLEVVIVRHSPISCGWRAPASCSRAKACSRWSTRGRCRCRRRPRIALGAPDRTPERQGRLRAGSPPR